MIEQVLPYYSSPGRHYHTIGHVEDCLRQLGDIKNLSSEEREILTQALLWHDAVYDPMRSDNEERSAALAVDHCNAGIRDEVGRLILLTKSHNVDDTDRLGSIMISIDLSILGADAAEYAKYIAAIREEYRQIPEDIYRKGRAAILKRFLERPAIYPYPPLRERLEQTARRNIAREIADPAG